MAVYRRSRRHRFFLVLLALTSVTVLTLDYRGGGDGAMESVRQTARDAFAPLQSAANWAISPVTGFFGSIGDFGNLRAENARLRRQLDEATRARKRQAAPFAKGQPTSQPKKPGRKPGKDYGAKAHRRPPSPEQIDEVHEATLPDVCPDCGCPLDQTHVAHQFQVEIPRKPIHRQFNIHVGQCRQCQRRVQGRHPLQTSDALGAAAAQLGPDAQAAVVELQGVLQDARGTLRKVDAVLVEAQGIGANVRGATNDLGRLRADVDANLHRIEGMIDQLNRRWPFARETEIKLP